MQQLTLKKFFARKNKILIYHKSGGLGDALMQRMLIKDVKDICQDCDLYLACLSENIDAFKDHQCLKNVIDIKNVDHEEYGISYNTCVTISDKYENKHAPCQEHRSDILAKILGINLYSHEMNFDLDLKCIEDCKNKLQSLKKNPDKPVVLLAPYSRMATKSLLDWQIKVIAENTKEANLIGIHKYAIKPMSELNLPVIQNVNIQEWMCYIAAADYVISVDTAAFHMAGGLKKPLMGIFTFADGKVYGKYFDFILVQKHRDNGNWDCGPCFKLAECTKSNKPQKPCLTEISEKELKEGIQKMFAKW